MSNAPPERARSQVTKYALYDIIKMEVGRCGNWNVLIANLKRQGVEVHFAKQRGRPAEVQGVVFSMNDYHFNGSKVDPGVSVIPRLTRLCSTTDAGTYGNNSRNM
ncbi:hypothetical protein NXX56_29310 [Bacteroides thetaiotaomicron]|nr:hypothetical protein [Bacteroides thetaiotaomicron]